VNALYNIGRLKLRGIQRGKIKINTNK